MLLTGASRGHRHATVKRFRPRVARHHMLAPRLSRKLPWEMGPEDHFRSTSRRRRHRRGIAEVKERSAGGGQLHALVNNAGISPKGRGRRAVRRSRPAYEDWLHVFHVNFFASIMLARGLVEELSSAKGSVVNVTSIAGARVHPFAGAAYSTSKAALAALTREMAADFGTLGVRVNAISPGEIDTAILSPGTEKIVEQIPLRRLGTPDEVAKAIYFLCTDASSYVNGAELHINGGQHV
jgi:NAD(P)-dependent dehydrogenase (short-subunit alcohol dehydrogenase family)